ncbi:MAG TPA: AtpZ/AtpI family protein [Kofleriaceae bacterium]
MKPGAPATTETADFSIRGVRRARYSPQNLRSTSVGLELGISVIVGLLAGYYLDQRLGTTPWLMLVFLVLGLIAGFRGVMRAVKREDKHG